MDLLREQVKMLAGELALCTSSLKRLSEQEASNLKTHNFRLRLKNENREKKLQIHVLEQRMIGSVEITPRSSYSSEMSQTAEIDALKQEHVKIIKEKDGLVIHSQKLAEDGSYAKELATAAAVELRNLAEEVTMLWNEMEAVRFTKMPN